MDTILGCGGTGILPMRTGHMLRMFDLVAEDDRRKVHRRVALNVGNMLFDRAQRRIVSPLLSGYKSNNINWLSEPHVLVL
ncbi:hypothetical protein HQ563_04750 [bacterium]|nr:hypothetical protein [bacterium]